jgi:hypothetical protein
MRARVGCMLSKLGTSKTGCASLLFDLSFVELRKAFLTQNIEASLETGRSFHWGPGPSLSIIRKRDERLKAGFTIL